MATEALTVAGVDAYYGDSHVLHGVSFALEEGHLLGLLGRNGAGKTTCMSAIMGFLRPRHGSINLFGEEIAGFAPDTIAHRGIGLVPQGRRVFRSLTVRENLGVAEQRRARTDNRPAWNFERVYALFPRLKEREQQLAGSLSGGEQQMLAIGRALMGNPRVLLMGAYVVPDRAQIKRRLGEVYSLFPRLKERTGQLAATLSGGEQQMLAIGRALVREPDVLLLDEPSLGLAPVMIKVIYETLRRIRERGMTLLLAEQSAHIALKIADRAYVLETGRVTYAGDAASLRTDRALRESYLGA